MIDTVIIPSNGETILTDFHREIIGGFDVVEYLNSPFLGRTFLAEHGISGRLIVGLTCMNQAVAVVAVFGLLGCQWHSVLIHGSVAHNPIDDTPSLVHSVVSHVCGA